TPAAPRTPTIRAATPAPARPRLVTAALHPPLRPAPWEPPRPEAWTHPRPGAARMVPAGYRAPAYRPPPRPASGGSLLGMAHTYGAGQLAPPAPMPMPAIVGGGG
ncbi:MAG: hypothetical protein ACREFY_03540, partial [Acetobacteraceae bacterium]